MRLTRTLWLLVPGVAATACPAYPDGCASRDDCAPGYYCDYPTGQCLLPNDYVYGQPDSSSAPVRCTDASDCAPGQFCDRYARCMSPDDGAAGASAAGEAGMAGASGAG